MESVIRVQNLNKAVSLYTNTLEKVMNLSLFPAMSK